MNEVEALNKQILELQLRKAEIINGEKFKKEENIKKLDWLADCDGRLETWLSGSGLPKYKLVVWGKNIPRVTGSLTVMGESKSCYENILFRNDSEFSSAGSFETDSTSLFIEFLQKHKLKSLKYDFELYKTLKTIHGMYKNDELSR